MLLHIICNTAYSSPERTASPLIFKPSRYDQSGDREVGGSTGWVIKKVHIKYFSWDSEGNKLVFSYQTSRDLFCTSFYCLFAWTWNCYGFPLYFSSKQYYASIFLSISLTNLNRVSYNIWSTKKNRKIWTLLWTLWSSSCCKILTNGVTLRLVSMFSSTWIIMIQFASGFMVLGFM